jgi:hypothetical protein
MENGRNLHLWSFNTLHHLQYPCPQPKELRTFLLGPFAAVGAL